MEFIGANKKHHKYEYPDFCKKKSEFEILPYDCKYYIFEFYVIQPILSPEFKILPYDCINYIFEFYVIHINDESQIQLLEDINIKIKYASFFYENIREFIYSNYNSIVLYAKCWHCEDEFLPEAIYIKMAYQCSVCEKKRQCDICEYVYSCKCEYCTKTTEKLKDYPIVTAYCPDCPEGSESVNQTQCMICLYRNQEKNKIKFGAQCYYCDYKLS